MIISPNETSQTSVWIHCLISRKHALVFNLFWKEDDTFFDHFLMYFISMTGRLLYLNSSRVFFLLCWERWLLVNLLVRSFSEMEKRKQRGRCCPFISGNWYQNTWEQCKAMLDWTLGMSLLQGWSNTETCFLVRCLIPCACVCSLCVSVLKRHLDNTFIKILQLLISPEDFRQMDSMISVGLFQLNYFILYFLMKIKPRKRTL